MVVDMKKINTEKWQCIDETIYNGEKYKLWEHKIFGDEKYAIVTYSDDNIILDKTYDSLNDWIEDSEYELS